MEFDYYDLHTGELIQLNFSEVHMAKCLCTRFSIPYGQPVAKSSMNPELSKKLKFPSLFQSADGS